MTGNRPPQSSRSLPEKSPTPTGSRPQEFLEGAHLRGCRPFRTSRPRLKRLAGAFQVAAVEPPMEGSVPFVTRHAPRAEGWSIGGAGGRLPVGRSSWDVQVYKERRGGVGNWRVVLLEFEGCGGNTLFEVSILRGQTCISGFLPEESNEGCRTVLFRKFLLFATFFGFLILQDHGKLSESWPSPGSTKTQIRQGFSKWWLVSCWPFGLPFNNHQKEN